MKNGLIGYMFQNQPRNKLEKLWWKIKGLFGYNNKGGIPIIVSNKVKPDSVSYMYLPQNYCKSKNKSKTN